MKAIIKYHEKTSDENQMFVLDTSKHYQIIPLEDHIPYHTGLYQSNKKYKTRIDLSKYNGVKIFGIFDSYSKIDEHSMFIIDTTQIDREIKINQLLDS